MSKQKKINLLGIYLILILIILVVLPILTYIFKFGDSLIRALIYIASSGGLGGTIYSVRGFYQNLGEDKFKFNWIWWFILRPIISMIIGVFVYFLIVGGLISLGAIQEVDFLRSVIFYCGVSFLAGFSFTQFATKLENLAETLFSIKKENKK